MQRLALPHRRRGALQTLWTGAATLLLGALLVVFSGDAAAPGGEAAPKTLPSEEPCPIAKSVPEPPCEEVPDGEKLRS